MLWYWCELRGMASRVLPDDMLSVCLHSITDSCADSRANPDSDLAPNNVGAHHVGAHHLRSHRSSDRCSDHVGAHHLRSYPSPDPSTHLGADPRANHGTDHGADHSGADSRVPRQR